RADGARRPRHSERDEVVRQVRHGEARGPDLVDGRRLQQAAGKRRARARAGRGVLVRHRLPHRQKDWPLGVPGVEGAHGEGGGGVRGGRGRQPGDPVPLRHRGRGARQAGLHHRPRHPLPALRRRGGAQGAPGHRAGLRLRAAGARRGRLPRRDLRRRGGRRREVHLQRRRHHHRRDGPFPGRQVPAVRRQHQP
ncbi:hypothetical protein ACJX0J_041275, partial [Zea mays]